MSCSLDKGGRIGHRSSFRSYSRTTDKNYWERNFPVKKKRPCFATNDLLLGVRWKVFEGLRHKFIDNFIEVAQRLVGVTERLAVGCLPNGFLRLVNHIEHDLTIYL